MKKSAQKKERKYRVVHEYGKGKYIDGQWTAWVPVKKKPATKKRGEIAT